MSSINVKEIDALETKAKLSQTKASRFILKFKVKYYITFSTYNVLTKTKES